MTRFPRTIIKSSWKCGARISLAQSAGRLTRRHPLRTCASSAAGEDPYKVFGLSRNANSDAVNRAYKRKLAENRGDEAALARIEEAHSAIMMSQLTARLQGGVAVEKDIKYADRAVYFPWRPRLYKASKEVILYSGIAHAVMAAWGLLLRASAGSQPIVACAVIGAGANIYKLQQIFPPGPSGSSSENSALKNLLRGAALATLATFLGCFLIFTVPDFLAAQLNRQMPYWFYESEQALLALGTALSNWVMSSFFR
ncbi:g6434 [Coccomyxa elongata]